MGAHNPQPRLLALVADLLKLLGAISRCLNIYKILMAMESPLSTERFAFETCTQAPSDMCITTILFKWHQAVVGLIECGFSFRSLITNEIPTSHGFSLRVFVAEGSRKIMRDARHDHSSFLVTANM